MTDSRRWRVGTHYGIHGYAENDGPDDDEPIFTAMSKRFADLIIADHNSRLLYRTELVRLLEENQKLATQLGEANKLITQLRGSALKTMGTARRAYTVLGELLHERTVSTADAADDEAACE